MSKNTGKRKFKNIMSWMKMNAEHIKIQIMQLNYYIKKKFIALKTRIRKEKRSLTSNQ